MIRFVDLTDAYEGTPICAFLNTTTDRFLTNGDEENTFFNLEEIAEHPDSNRLLRLMPEGFFERKPMGNEYRFHWSDGGRLKDTERTLRMRLHD